jgi:hypothetical protein
MPISNLTIPRRAAGAAAILGVALIALSAFAGTQSTPVTSNAPPSPEAATTVVADPGSKPTPTSSAPGDATTVVADPVSKPSPTSSAPGDATAALAELLLQPVPTKSETAAGDATAALAELLLQPAPTKSETAADTDTTAVDGLLDELSPGVSEKTTKPVEAPQIPGNYREGLSAAGYEPEVTDALMEKFERNVCADPTGRGAAQLLKRYDTPANRDLLRRAVAYKCPERSAVVDSILGSR